MLRLMIEAGVAEHMVAPELVDEVAFLLDRYLARRGR
jgi:hypothetical protein